ncbi:hypothetical protein BSL78_08868 [Apostichopus japonicus]|uniref:Uncharacterized protein n=1 Tax=Stichopus japonicus TaxID=307972 RepID=A0A2G8L1W0_STIJA|nr:hypothetical protein BSL78_08868 [Apostichopus japonicus]
MEAESDEITGPETSRPKRARLPNGRLDDYVITEAIGNRSASASSQQMSKLKATMYEAVDITLSEFRRRFSDNAWLYQATSAASRKSEDFFQIPLAALGVNSTMKPNFPCARNSLIAAFLLQTRATLMLYSRKCMSRELLSQIPTTCWQTSQRLEVAVLSVRVLSLQRAGLINLHVAQCSQAGKVTWSCLHSRKREQRP